MPDSTRSVAGATAALSPTTRAINPLGMLMRVAVPGLIAYGALADIRARMQQGENPVIATAKGVASTALATMMPFWPYMTLAVGTHLAKAAATSLVNYGITGLDWTRELRTPFSQRFEHSDVTAVAQAIGLQAIQGSWAHSRMGSEASVFARRFGR